MEQTFSETGRSIENLILEILFEINVYNFESIIMMGSVQAPLSSHTYSYVNFKNNTISW